MRGNKEEGKNCHAERSGVKRSADATQSKHPYPNHEPK